MRRTLFVMALLASGVACDGAGGDLLQTIPTPATPSDVYCVTRLSTATDPTTYAGLCATPPTWSAIASADCEAMGLLLKTDSVETGATCEPDAAGRLRYTDVKYPCCLADTCSLERQGDGTTCLDAAAWTDLATRACAIGGLVVRGPLSWEVCADGVTFGGVVYGCCRE